MSKIKKSLSKNELAYLIKSTGKHNTDIKDYCNSTRGKPKELSEIDQLRKKVHISLNSKKFIVIWLVYPFFRRKLLNAH